MFWYEESRQLRLSLQRFDEARQIIHEAQARKWMISTCTMLLYALAFLRGGLRCDGGTATVVCGKPEYENFGLALASDTEAYGGHLAKARELTKRAWTPPYGLTTKKVGRYGRRLPLSGKRLTAILRKRGSQQQRL
jgi:hypothetical protein